MHFIFEVVYCLQLCQFGNCFSLFFVTVKLVLSTFNNYKNKIMIDTKRRKNIPNLAFSLFSFLKFFTEKNILEKQVDRWKSDSGTNKMWSKKIRKRFKLVIRISENFKTFEKKSVKPLFFAHPNKCFCRARVVLKLGLQVYLFFRSYF